MLNVSSQTRLPDLRDVLQRDARRGEGAAGDRGAGGGHRHRGRGGAHRGDGGARQSQEEGQRAADELGGVPEVRYITHHTSYSGYITVGGASLNTPII